MSSNSAQSARSRRAVMAFPENRKKNIIEHMNEDHEASLIAYARAYADLPATRATLTALGA